MRTAKIIINSGVIITMVIYLLTAFVKMELNPIVWSEDVRSLIVGIWVFIQIIQMLIIFSYLDSEKTKKDSLIN